ncbi:MAG TPA: EamA family transporter [Aquabacterium sp.]|nr:EamA family transporter [Aquabacterium sp.]
MPHSRWPAVQGGALALAAAVLFGVSTPLVQLAGDGVGAFSTASLLYVGAALIGLLTRQSPEREARLRRGDLPRLLAMALFGAGIGPVALAWGLQKTSGTSASLLLTLEALFTALLARVLYGESMDRRVWGAMLLLMGGGIVLVLDQGRTGQMHLIGLLAVMAATIAWGVDNALSRGVADRDPGQVVLGKAMLGAAMTTAVAALTGESMPGWPAALALVAIGATGYGLSLRFYLLAQRAFGASRTGSVFAFAPFIGAAVAMALGEPGIGWGGVIGSALMVAGVVLHLAESHHHEHQHRALEHDHAHTHEDGHHQHRHEVMPRGAHSHPHRHEPMTHAHAHVPDQHHDHGH